MTTTPPATSVSSPVDITISSYAHGRNNNLNLLRIVAASLVLFTHSFGLTGYGELEPLHANFGISFGSWAVNIFFVISGFLVCKSWDRRKSVKVFLWSRAIRIFPALWICTVATVLVVGVWFTTLSLREYLLHIDTAKFVGENSTILLNGVFTSLPGAFSGSSVNLSLWTLPYELKMYLLLLLLGWSGLLYSRGIAALMTVVSFVVYVWHVLGGEPEVTVAEYCRFIFCFFSGVVLYLYRNYVVLHHYVVGGLVALIALSLLIPQVHMRALVLTALTPYLMIYLALVPGGIIRSYNSVGDYSYGIYIYAGPVQQCVLAVAGGTMTYMQNFLWSFAVTLVLAIISWHFIEDRALKFKPFG